MINILHNIEEDIKKIKKNMIGYSKRLQEELLKLANMHSINERDIHTKYCKEFCNKFNLCATNKINNSVELCVNPHANNAMQD